MIDKFNELNLESLYLKAKTTFKECMSCEGNEYLNEEISIPYNEIVLKNDSVTIQFLETDLNHYIIETKLMIFSQNNQEIGWYSLQEDENGKIVDDYLLFE